MEIRLTNSDNYAAKNYSKSISIFLCFFFILLVSYKIIAKKSYLPAGSIVVNEVCYNLAPRSNISYQFNFIQLYNTGLDNSDGNNWIKGNPSQSLCNKLDLTCRV